MTNLVTLHGGFFDKKVKRWHGVITGTHCQTGVIHGVVRHGNYRKHNDEDKDAYLVDWKGDFISVE